MNGAPPTGGGGGTGESIYIYFSMNRANSHSAGWVNNVVVRGVKLDRVNAPLHLYQTNGGHTSVVRSKTCQIGEADCGQCSGDRPSTLTFGNLHFINWTGSALTNKSKYFTLSPSRRMSKFDILLG